MHPAYVDARHQLVYRRCQWGWECWSDYADAWGDFVESSVSCYPAVVLLHPWES